MRTRQLSAAVGLVAALGLTVTACGSDAADSGAAKTSAAPAASASTGQPATPADATPAAGAASTPASTPANATPAAKETVQAGAAAGSGPRKCTAADLNAEPANMNGAQVPDSQGEEAIELTNKSGATCTMKGYPGVDLVGPRGTWSLVRAQGSPQLVTLQPGGKAYVSITYLPYGGDGEVEFKVDRIVITPPDDTHQLTVQWLDVMPQDQTGATHPVTYINPIIAHR
ncbi:DUF4232 domain-containing protein [Kitasatospora sp. NPDC092948]|uniref:DUF4232 domain-containing protein n=1 Tax=Kitasatospora sp. NPDC092948 TaxID=3364088 RepID=UPI003817C915